MKQHAELKPQKGGRSTDRAEGLLRKRVGQVRTLLQVLGRPDKERTEIRRQLKRSGANSSSGSAQTAAATWCRRSARTSMTPWC